MCLDHGLPRIHLLLRLPKQEKTGQMYIDENEQINHSAGFTCPFHVRGKMEK